MNKKMPLNTAQESVKVRRGTVGRLFRMIGSFYPVMLPVAIVCIIINAVVSSVPSIFMQKMTLI